MNEVYNRTVDRLNGKRIDIVTLTHMRSGHDDNSKYYMKRIGVVRIRYLGVVKGETLEYPANK